MKLGVSGGETYGKLRKRLWKDGGERVAGARLQRGVLFVLQRSIQRPAQHF